MGISWTKRNGRLARAAAATAMAAAVATMFSVQGAGASTSTTHGLHTRGAHTASTSGGLLIDHGGRVLPASNTYLIFWGPQSAWSANGSITGLQSLFQGFNGSNYLGIAGQYMRGAAIGSSYVTTKFDSSNPPSRVSPSTLGNEVVHLFGSSPDPTGLYLVYTSNFPRGGNFCAWHSLATSGRTQFSVAYMPNTNGVGGCNPGNPYNLTGSEQLRSLANVSAHEFMETVTDALPSSGTYGWIDSSGSEIGDKCAWQFNGAVTLGSTAWQLQEEWSNAANSGTGGCAQGN